MRRHHRAILCASQLSLAIGCSAAHAIDIHFDYTSFDNPGTPGNPHFGQAQFDVLNYPSINGNYMMTSTDNHRPEMVANNNQLAEFYNFLQDRYNEQAVKDGFAAANVINQYTITNSTKNGPRPDWVVLNEMSTSLWPSSATYRQWVVDVATQLHDVHGYNVVTYTTFANPSSNAAEWQALASKSYIAIENYLSGKEVMNNGTDYNSRKTWAQAQYAWSKTAYGNLGVDASRLFLSEHYGNTLSTAGWGRAGIASADWDTVLQIRADAILGANYPGFLAYGWGSNGMLISEAEQIQHELWYRTRRVLQTQQPQWLVDNAISVGGTTIPLSWNEQLNWIGGVPNASGAVANFFRTNTAARTITLDGNKTVGTLTFNSPSSYTVNAGTGGSITLMGPSGATLGVTSGGTHTINVPVIAGSTSVFTSAGTLNLNGGLSTSGAVTILRNGAGTLNIAGPQSHAAGATFVASGGMTNFNSSVGGNLSVTVNVATTVNFNTSQNLATLTLGGGSNAKLASGTRMLATTNVTGTGKLDLTDGALIARSGSIGTLSAGTYSGILGMVQAGRNNGAWNGDGIYTSFTAAQGAAPLTTLATALASDALGISPTATGTWRGQSITGSAVLIAYTYAGDANLSGAIDADDYFQITSGYNDPSGMRSYFKGDFNYDGQVNADDFFIIDANFLGQGDPMTGGAVAGASAIPEPAGVWGGISLISAGLLSAARRRKV